MNLYVNIYIFRCESWLIIELWFKVFGFINPAALYLKCLQIRMKLET